MQQMLDGMEALNDLRIEGPSLDAWAKDYLEKHPTARHTTGEPVLVIIGGSPSISGRMARALAQLDLAAVELRAMSASVADATGAFVSLGEVMALSLPQFNEGLFGASFGEERQPRMSTISGAPYGKVSGRIGVTFDEVNWGRLQELMPKARCWDGTPWLETEPEDRKKWWTRGGNPGGTGHPTKHRKKTRMQSKARRKNRK